MNAFPRRKRSLAAALIAAAAIVPLASSTTADAAVTTTKWNRSVYLQHALGFAANSTPVIDSVTYDRFQHLLRQSGNFAILIGDPKTDPTFAARARTVEAAAKAEGISKVYWFNPNLTGGAAVGTTAWPNFDIRNSASITSLTAASRNKYNDAWGNIVAQSLGNGVVATRTNPGAASQAVTTAAGTNVNDVNAPVFDYTGGWPAVPANSQDSYFLVYNTDNTVGADKDKIVSSVNLTDDADVATKVAAAIDGKTFATVQQFEWWKEEANERARAAATNATLGPDVPVLTDADRDGWSVNQITLPELVDLLQNATDADAAILLGGTWCPNTRAVLPFVNKAAKAQNVTVYNYDTVLDGGKVAGNPTGGSNPLQTRNAHNNGAFPSFLYAELVQQFLSNFQTEYQVTGTNAITYFPNGDTTKTADKVARLQVPYLFGYKGTGGTQPFGGTTRHWLIKGATPAANKEYMSNWWMTNPQPNQIGLTGLPQAAPYWTTLNQRLADYTWKTTPAAVLADRTISTDATQFILDGDTATVTATATGLSVASGGANPLPAGPAAIAPALAALGANAPTSFDDLKAKHVAERAKPAAEQNQTYLGQLNALAAPWGLADTRKSSVNTAWGNVTTPSSVIGGAAAKRALEVFFGGLPGGSLYTARTVAANDVVEGTAPTVTLGVTFPAGRTPTSNLAIDVKRAGATVHTGTAAVSGGAASFTLPATLAPGTYEYTVSYAGDEFIDAWSETRSLTVTPAPVVETPTPDPVIVPITTPGPTATVTPTPVATKAKASKVRGAIATRPTTKKAGKYKVTITTASGKAKATGKVTLTLKKGKTTKKVTGTLKNGVVTVTVPKLAKGTWKVTVAWAGDKTYQSASASGASIKVTK